MKTIAKYSRWILSFFCLFSLAACNIKGPFHHPSTSTQLLTAVNLPTPRLAVPVPVTIKIPNRETANRFTRALTSALVAQNVPAVSRAPSPGDWWIDLEAHQQGDFVIAHYAIMGANNIIQSQGDTDPVEKSAWDKSDHDALNTVALQIAPAVAHALSDIQADRMTHDPMSLQSRPSRLYLQSVNGAPGDGNLLLSRAFYSAYPKDAGTLLTTNQGADFLINTEVNLSNAPADAQGNPQQQIELIWHVQATMDKKEVGAATQIHAIPAHSLDGNWGDTAVAAANEAGPAIAQIIANYTGKNRKSLLSPESKILSEPLNKPDPMNTPVEKNY
ncbi:hypothetical protein FAI41_06715 [Acetobacteraceae bacterium]|nr:hypothetical protein FAI41_06715 [Acetobacteraceae bacterium]